MSTYSELQKHNRFLKNEVTGTVILGSGEDNSLNVISLDPKGNLKFESENIASKSIGFGEVINFTGSKELIGSIPPSVEGHSIKSIIFTGDGLGELTIEENSTPKMVIRNSFFEQTKEMTVGFKVKEDKELKFYVRNTSIENKTNAYECYVFYD